jgi:lysophospholipase L1-like esterase
VFELVFECVGLFAIFLVPMSRAIVCLGDSITCGIFSDGYPSVLQDLLNQRQPGQFVVKKHGIAGTTVNDWLSAHLSSPEYKQTVAGGCDAIVLMLGTNDARVGCGFNEQQFGDKMRQLVNRLKTDAPGAAIFLATPTPVAGPNASFMYDPQIIHTAFPRIFPQIAASLGATCIDCCSPLGGCNANQRFFGDGVHPSQEGDNILASIVCEHVMRIRANPRCNYSAPPPAYDATIEQFALMQGVHPSMIAAGLSARQDQAGSPNNLVLPTAPEVTEVSEKKTNQKRAVKRKEKGSIFALSMFGC